MTNHWIDLKNSDVIMIIGSNCAENHPASFKWIHEAMDKGTKLIVVDPRVTRTASRADIYAPMRSGTDIVFFGGLINYALENELYHKEYVVKYTNAATLINPEFKGPVDLDGFFSGFDEEKGSYDRATWKYQVDRADNPLRDETLEDPNCVFQHLKKHYARYTPDIVEKVTGCPKEKFLEIAKVFCSTGQPGKAGTTLYAMGGTQHTVGSQNVRSHAVLQLLLGNVGMPGGGVNALRGIYNVQGSTDMAVLFHIIPGYMAAPRAKDHPTFEDYLSKETPKTSYWSNKPKFFVSLLKAWWGDKAIAENDFAYDYLPKASGNYSWISLFEAMNEGVIKGTVIMGQNPAVCGPNSRFERQALRKLDWLVVMDLFETETAAIWKEPGIDPANVNTEVFLLPAKDAMEKDGSLVTSGRLIQWRLKVAEGPEEAKEDIEILDLMMNALKNAYAGSAEAKDKPILDLDWNYGNKPTSEMLAKEINGYFTKDVVDATGVVVGKQGDLVPLFTALKDDGSTACGNWLFSGYYYPRDDGTGVTSPASKRRGQDDPGGLGIYPNWAFAWPANRHIIYNRCSADPDGNPWSKEKALVWWDADQKKWTGYDVPDFNTALAPTAPGGTSPFIMKTDGKGWIFGALNEGPFPEHYEPVESPVDNLLSNQQVNPAIKIWDTDKDKEIGDRLGTKDKFPIICTTYRLVEHWQAGAMSRNLGWLAETQPDMFVEISKELAEEKDIKNGDTVIVSSARGEIKAIAVVTVRFQPFTINGKMVHHIGMPWHYGWMGLATGDIANDLTPHVGDANTMIPEYKAFLVDIRKEA